MNKKNLIISIVTSVFLSGCAAPLILAGGGILVTVPLRKKGISGTMNDATINTSIASKLHEWDSKAFTQVDADVHAGEVLLTGLVDNPEFATKAEKIVWKVDGVRAVYNHIQTDSNSFLNYTKDTWITTKIKSKFLADQDIHNLNYTVKTLAGVVYIIGTADNQKEMEVVHNVARSTNGVSKVISYVTIKGQEG